MSSRGMTQAQIEARRRELERQREKARRNKVKQQVTELAKSIEKAQQQLAKTGSGAWVQQEVSQIMQVVEDAQKTPSSGEIDSMLQQLHVQQVKISSLSEVSKARQDESQRKQWMAESAIVGLKLELSARSEELEYNDSMEALEELQLKVEDINTKVLTGETVNLEQQISKIRYQALEIHQEDTKKSVDEKLRREIITALIKTMRELGFAVGKPTIDKETGGVVMIGKLPNNRSIRFEVNLDGQMEFDMNGFLERKCADHLDEVLGLLEKNFTIATGPVQHNWKNPDRISKGSKGLPTGGNTRTIGGKKNE